MALNINNPTPGTAIETSFSAPQNSPTSYNSSPGDTKYETAPPAEQPEIQHTTTAPEPQVSSVPTQSGGNNQYAGAWQQQMQPQQRGDELWLQYSQLMGNPEDAERQQRAHRQKLGILAVADAMRHMGNIYHTTQYAPSQKFNSPVTEEDDRHTKQNYLLAEQRAKAADRLRQHIKLVEDAKYAQLEEARKAEKHRWEEDRNRRDNEYNQARIESMRKRDELAEQKAERDKENAESMRQYREGMLQVAKDRNAIARARGTGGGGGRGRGGGGRRYYSGGGGRKKSSGGKQDSQGGFQHIQTNGGETSGATWTGKIWGNIQAGINNVLNAVDARYPGVKYGKAGKNGLPCFGDYYKSGKGIRLDRTYQTGDIYVGDADSGNHVFWSPKRKEYYSLPPIEDDGVDLTVDDIERGADDWDADDDYLFGNAEAF